jgi:very-short-patch-repair endonuclease
MGFYSDEEKNELLEELRSLDKKTRERIEDILFDKLSDLLNVIEECESPIENLMAIALDQQANLLGKVYGIECIVNSQYEIKINDKTYRSDFMLGVLLPDGKSFSIVVECDGHEFHEKTKEQSARDKARDRAIQSKGMNVLRFTGSEIWNDAGKCAREVADFIKSLAGLN